jgi:hypothetical protein
MNLTIYHSRHFAYELTRRCAFDGDEKLAGAPMASEAGLVVSQKWVERAPLKKGQQGLFDEEPE